MFLFPDICSGLGAAGAVKDKIHRARQRPKLRRDCRGAVAVEMAIMLPVFLVLAIGMFDVGNFMLNDLELAFVTNNAATVQASNGAGALWGQNQIPAASFTASSSSCGAVITSSWPYQGLIFGVTLSQTACAPIITRAPG
jgi:TadE-like protein